MTLHEDTLIQTLAKQSQGFIGDDAAVLPISHEHLIITKDMLIENTHFNANSISALDLGYKALQANLSDLAAMGAQPKYVLCGIALPKNRSDYAKKVLSSLQQACLDNNVILIGGDTCQSETLCISITAIGFSINEHIRYRQGAQSSDMLCHVGNLGHAHLGWQASEKKLAIHPSYHAAFCRPNALIEEGLFLGKQPAVSSMMDVSDGLLIDIKRLCEQSHLGAHIQLEKIPLDDRFKETALSMDLDPLSTAVIGGEDYGLLFTVTHHLIDSIAHDFFRRFKKPITLLGEMTSKNTIQYTLNNQAFTPSIKPFTHFGEYDS